MDELLKARKMGSAAARRLKTEEREKFAQETEDRRQRKLLYGYSSSEDESSDDDSPTYSPIVDDHCEYPNVSTTQGKPGTLTNPNTAFILSVQQHKSIDSPASKGTDDVAQQKTRTHFLSPPQSPSFIRDPTILDDDDASMMDLYSDLSGAEDDYNMPSSPGITCTAKSVHYLAPISKPSIVSIRQSLQSIRTAELEGTSRGLLTMQLSPPPRSVKRLSTAASMSSLVPADRALKQEAPSSKSSQVALKPLALRADSMPVTSQHREQSPDKSTDPETPHRPTLKSSKKPSFTRPSTSHGEETPSSGKQTAQPLSRSSFYYSSFPHPPAASAPSRDPSPLPASRPRDSVSFFKVGSKAKNGSSTSLSEANPQRVVRVGTEPVQPKPDASKSLTRKKSFSGLRSRSESLSKAFRSSSGGKGRGRFPVAPHEDSPPVPEIRPEVVRKASQTSFMTEDTSVSRSAGTGLGLRHMPSRMTVALD